jgi:hypothetical protein
MKKEKSAISLAEKIKKMRQPWGKVRVVLKYRSISHIIVNYIRESLEYRTAW